MRQQWIPVRYRVRYQWSATPSGYQRRTNLFLVHGQLLRLKKKKQRAIKKPEVPFLMPLSLFLFRFRARKGGRGRNSLINAHGTTYTIISLSSCLKALCGCNLSYLMWRPKIQVPTFTKHNILRKKPKISICCYHPRLLKILGLT